MEENCLLSLRMVSAFFTFEKGKVIQALRYHFISRKEIKIMIVLVNVFALVSAALYFFKKIQPLPFLLSSVMWFILMITFWYLLPSSVYKRSQTFKERFRVRLDEHRFTLETENGSKSWEWPQFSGWMESPLYFHLYFNSRTFFIFPKEAFEGEEEHAIRKLIASHIPKG